MNVAESANEKQAEKNKAKSSSKEKEVSSGFRKKILFGQKDDMKELANKLPDNMKV